MTYNQYLIYREILRCSRGDDVWVFNYSPSETGNLDVKLADDIVVSEMMGAI